MWFEILCVAVLLVSGFVTIFLGAMGFNVVVESFLLAPISSVISIFAVIGLVTAGILLISGAFRKAREIKEDYIN